MDRRGGADCAGSAHVGWMRTGAGTSVTILHSSISANAKTVSGPHTVFGYSGGADQSVALVRAPEGIRAFFAGLEPGSAVDRAMATGTSANGQVKGDGSKTTGKSGTVVFSLSPGRHTATVTKKGYAPATTAPR